LSDPLSSSSIQLDVGGGVADSMAGTAEAGFSGASSEMPHRAAIESSYGVDLSGVKAYTGPEAQSALSDLGAKGMAKGNQVAFDTPTPSLHVAAHETAHLMQQTDGIQLASKFGRKGDQHEVNADAAADRVTAGESATDLLPNVSKISGDSGSVQFYLDQAVHGEPARVSDDGKMAVMAPDLYGSQIAYADPSLIGAASAKLQASTSVLTLTAGSYSATVTDESGKSHTLKDIVVTNNANSTSDFGMELWADCGRSARTVSGVDGGTGQGSGSLVANYNNAAGDETLGSSSDWGEIQKVMIFKEHFASQINVAKVDQLLKAYKAAKRGWATEKDATKKKNYRRQMSRASKQADVLSRAAYEKLSEAEKRTFDKKVGINAYADPEIGEAYHISTGGGTHPGLAKGGSTWNFHWAGVVMKSGGDNITLENYSVGDYGVANTDWVYQMYGTGKKMGQSLHEQHRDDHKQHGTSPTTMRMSHAP
jgi:hypothetical protein